jgi:hypothetical protein
MCVVSDTGIAAISRMDGKRRVERDDCYHEGKYKMQNVLVHTICYGILMKFCAPVG